MLWHAANEPTTMTENRRKRAGCEKQIRRRHPCREFVVDGIGRGREVLETFPKPATYCHLLPFWGGKIATTVSIVPIPFFPPEDYRPA